MCFGNRIYVVKGIVGWIWVIGKFVVMICIYDVFCDECYGYCINFSVWNEFFNFFVNYFNLFILFSYIRCWIF